MKVALIKEAELPGLGKKYMVELEGGERLGIIIYDEGNRELFYFAPAEDEPTCSVTLTDQEARQVGLIIGGAFYQPKLLEKLEAAIADLYIEWLKVAPQAPVAGKTIGELGLRKNLGVTVIAVIEEVDSKKKKCTAINPGPGFTFVPGQTVVVAGRRDAIARFEGMVTGEGR
ncbi:MAG: cation:proton antiporter regulatory subunit [Desulfotomaculales bacterium]